MTADEHARDEQEHRAAGATRRSVLGAGALVALAGGAGAAPATAAGPPAAAGQVGAEVGTARESAAASERGVECVADLR